MRISAGFELKTALHDAIVADVDVVRRGCPFCGRKPSKTSPPYVTHVHGECLLIGILQRVDAVVSERAGKRIKL